MRKIVSGMHTSARSVKTRSKKKQQQNATNKLLYRKNATNLQAMSYKIYRGIHFLLINSNSKYKA